MLRLFFFPLPCTPFPLPYNQHWFDYSAWRRSFFVISLHKCLRSIKETQREQTDRRDILMPKWPLSFSIYRLKALLCFLQLVLTLPSLSIILCFCLLGLQGTSFFFFFLTMDKKTFGKYTVRGFTKDSVRLVSNTSILVCIKIKPTTVVAVNQLCNDICYSVVRCVNLDSQPCLPAINLKYSQYITTDKI